MRFLIAAVIIVFLVVAYWPGDGRSPCEATGDCEMAREG